MVWVSMGIFSCPSSSLVGGKLIHPNTGYGIKAGHALLLILARSSLKILNV